MYCIETKLELSQKLELEPRNQIPEEGSESEEDLAWKTVIKVVIKHIIYHSKWVLFLTLGF